MNIAVFDYGAGNLHSLIKVLARSGASVRVEEDLSRCLDAQLMVLPGVGAFGHAAERMKNALPATRAALKAGLPCLGICLGMQLLFERSEEGPGEGLGFFRGAVTRIKAQRLPQIGWNQIDETRGVPFEKSSLSYAYYANGFVCRAEQAADVVGWTTHEADKFPAAVRQGNVLGVQFHPEKSSTPGLSFVSAFLEELS
jgi:glutamine amidotransferase